jgi:tetratricopeptide (TPR) repeat protein
VAAYREPWNHRLVRWTRRHRAWTHAGAAALVMVALVASAAAVAVNRAYGHERRARAQSEADFTTARAAVERLYALASTDRDVLAMQNSEAVRERLAGEVVRSYDAILKTRPRDAAVRRDAARADRERANLRRLMGRLEPAAEGYERALARLRELVADSPRDDALLDALALLLIDRGALLRTRGRLDQAAAALTEAQELALGLRSRAPDSFCYRRTHAYVLTSRAFVEFDTGRFDEALQTSQQAYALWSTLAADRRADLLIEPVFAIQAKAQVAAAHRELGNPAAARKTYEEALAAAEARAKRFPGNSDTLIRLARVRNGLGDLLLEAEPARALTLFRGSLQDIPRVMRARPLVQSFSVDLATADNGLGGALRAAGQFTAAATACEKSRRGLEALIKQNDLHDYRHGLGSTLANLARIARDQGQPDRARDLHAQAIAQHERALAINRQSALDRKQRDQCREELRKIGERSSGASGADKPLPAAPR